MKKIIMERGHGKTTQLIFLSSKTNTPIITPFYKEHIKELAKELDVEIPEPLTLRELDNRCLLRFEIEEIKGRGQPAKHYALNEQQATLLMTYLKNTPNVRAFKKELVRQFFAMREELNRAKVSHAAKNAIRRAMTDALNEHIPDGPHKGHQIGNYTDLTYKLVFGKSAKKMREELGLKRKESVVPYMTSAEMDAVAKAEELVAVLTDMGLSYHQVKDCLLLGIVPAIAKKAE